MINAIKCVIKLSTPNVRDITLKTIKKIISDLFQEICLVFKRIMKKSIAANTPAEAPMDSLLNKNAMIKASIIAAQCMKHATPLLYCSYGAYRLYPYCSHPSRN